MEAKEKFTKVQAETIRTMDYLALTVKKLDQWERFHYLNKIKNFIDLIDNEN
jgi:hypothetical protein